GALVGAVLDEAHGVETPADKGEEHQDDGDPRQRVEQVVEQEPDHDPTQRVADHGRDHLRRARRLARGGRALLRLACILRRARSRDPVLERIDGRVFLQSGFAGRRHGGLSLPVRSGKNEGCANARPRGARPAMPPPLRTRPRQVNRVRRSALGKDWARGPAGPDRRGQARGQRGSGWGGPEPRVCQLPSGAWYFSPGAVREIRMQPWAIAY